MKGHAGWMNCVLMLCLACTLCQGATVVRAEVALTETLRAAESGDAQAQVSLGGLYLAGVGVPQDDDLAAYWFRKAADQGNAEGQYQLALAYGTGKGAPRDYEKAHDLLLKAAAQGHEKALNLLRSQLGQLR